MTATDPGSGRPLRDRIRFDRKGLHAMTADEQFLGGDRQAWIVRVVHEAIRQNYGRIHEETDGTWTESLSQVTKNRWDRFGERLRRALTCAKTPGQLRGTLCELFGRGGRNSTLQEGWATLLPMLDDNRWKLTRDLALLALASYSGRLPDPVRGNAAGE
jgi:CRISPR-associated protein Cas8a1/Csx13